MKRHPFALIGYGVELKYVLHLIAVGIYLVIKQKTSLKERIVFLIEANLLGYVNNIKNVV